MFNKKNLFVFRKKEFWRADFTQTWSGMCFNLHVEESEGENLIHLFLNTNLTFIVFIHDPEYFIYSSNPQALPMAMTIIQKTNIFKELRLIEREHTELNVQSDPCEEDTEYSFTVCVKTSLARMVGCWIKWSMMPPNDIWSPCNNINQFR